MDIKPGQIVYSRAGRDEGRKFVVVEVLDGIYLMVADGDLRRIENPKKKKLKHLEPTNEVIEGIYRKLSAGEKITNAELRKNLEVFSTKEV